MKYLCSGSPSKGVVEADECLACAKDRVNTCGMDYALIKALLDRQDRSEEVHVTDLTGCLRKAYWEKVDPQLRYVHEGLVLTLGTAVHGFLEGSDDHMDSELPLEGLGVQGTADVVYKDGRVVDFKCQPAGELVTIADGTEKPIEKIDIFDWVLAWDNRSFVPAQVTAILDGGYQDVFEVKIASKQTVRASGNHPVLTDRGWVQVGDLKAREDRVVQLKAWTGEGILSSDDARLLGYLTGDGSTSRQYGIGFTNADPEIVDDLAEMCRQRGWDLRLAGPSSKLGYHITNHGKKRSTTGPMKFIQLHGLHGKRAEQKSVPNAVLQGDAVTIGQFLAGYFDTDGTVTDPDGTVPSRIAFVTASPFLARQVPELLRRLDIACRVHKVNERHFQICVWQASEMLKFLERIPFRCASKRKRLEGWVPTLYAKERKGGKNLRRVESVINLGPMQTIGLEVKGLHTYVTNGVVVHNSTRWMYVDKLPYGSHALQVNIYAELLRQQGRPVDSLAIQYIDMSGPTKCRKCKQVVVPQNGDLVCPVCGDAPKGAHRGAILKEIPMLAPREIRELIEERGGALNMALESGLVPDAEPGYLCAYCPFTVRCPEAAV